MQLPWTCLESGTICNYWSSPTPHDRRSAPPSTSAPSVQSLPLHEELHPSHPLEHVLAHALTVRLPSALFYLHTMTPWFSVKKQESSRFFTSNPYISSQKPGCHHGASRPGLLSKNPNTPRVEEMDVAHRRPPNLANLLLEGLLVENLRVRSVYHVYSQ